LTLLFRGLRAVLSGFSDLAARIAWKQLFSLRPFLALPVVLDSSLDKRHPALSERELIVLV